MAALLNIGGALCSVPQSLADAHYYTVSTKKRPPPKHALKFSKLASFAQFQFNSMNICLFSIKVLNFSENLPYHH